MSTARITADHRTLTVALEGWAPVEGVATSSETVMLFIPVQGDVAVVDGAIGYVGIVGQPCLADGTPRPGWDQRTFHALAAERAGALRDAVLSVAIAHLNPELVP